VDVGLVRDGALVLKRYRWKPSTLSPVFGDIFQAEGFVLAFDATSRTRKFVLEVSTERARVRFTRMRGGER